jgi:hypothetical protein
MPSAATVAARSQSRSSGAVALPGTTAIMAEMPRISRMLAMLEPTTLPTAIPGDPAQAADREVRSSGIDVPKPSTTAPTTAIGSRIRVAKATPPRTRPSPPPSSRTSPDTIMIASIARPTPVALRGPAERPAQVHVRTPSRKARKKRIPSSRGGA